MKRIKNVKYCSCLNASSDENEDLQMTSRVILRLTVGGTPFWKNLMERKTQTENCMRGQIYARLKYSNTWNIVSFHFTLISLTKLFPPLIPTIINGKINFFCLNVQIRNRGHVNFKSIRYCHKGLESGSQNII